MPQPADHPLHPLVRKLESTGGLSVEERKAILRLPAIVRVLAPRQDAVRDGDHPAHCFLLMEGWAYRYKQLHDGRRQVTAFHIAGDLPDLQSVHLPVLDHSIGTITHATLAFIPHEPLRGLFNRFPGIAAALWRDTLVDAAIFREWVVNVGRRTAFQRLAHLFCELYLKQAAVGLAQGHRCPLPMTQTDLADATGLTSVHVNRTLKELRATGLITLTAGVLTIHDWAELAAAAGFDPAYLHLRSAAA